MPDTSSVQDPPSKGLMSMCGGDFVEVYRDQAAVFDCVATCFFLDTAHNVIEYMQVIWHTLKACTTPGLPLCAA